MNPEIKQKWIEALRSGKYAQTTKVLKTFDNRFCCLGVLCDIINPNKWVENKTYPQYMEYKLEYQGFFKMAPPEIMGNAEIATSSCEALARRNDGGDTFNEIADWIEQNL